MPDSLNKLLDEVRACNLCIASLPLGARPVLQVGASARIRIVGQAPGLRVHETGIPWNDASGARLREWMGVTDAQFYDPSRIAIIPMGFCYPGRAASGDMPPRPECAAAWHARLDAHLPRLGLTLLIGRYAQAHYLRGRLKPTLAQTVQTWREYLPSGYFPLPHPSPRNQPWLVKNAWFAQQVLPGLQRAVREALDRATPPKRPRR